MWLWVMRALLLGLSLGQGCTWIPLDGPLGGPRPKGGKECADEEIAYDGIDNDCDLDTRDDDLDDDGFANEIDCDDGDAAMNLGADELPYDGIDNDCDLDTRDDDLDEDGLVLAEDCDDTDPLRGGPEVPSDGIDNDCDSATDCDDTDLVQEWSGDVTNAEVPGFCESHDCRSISGDLILEDSELTDLSDLACLASVGEGLDVYNNDALTSLSGLSALTSVGGGLFVGYNNALLSLSGLDALTSVSGELFVGYNTQLCEDEVDALVAQLESFSGSVDNEGNTGICP